MECDRSGKRRYVIGGIVLLIVIIIATVAILKREWIYDFYRGMTYEPTSEMKAIREKLRLTERGEFLFNASQPMLSDSEEFNGRCRAGSDMEVAVLGCFTDRNIYVYDITDEELAGIRELTAAHELLHAVWARMSEEERTRLTSSLTQAFEANQGLLRDELETYDSGSRQEELYVRAGTEVKNLSADLEKHYAEIFADQDAVVDFYESYIKVFREIEAEMDALAAEMAEMRVEIDGLTAEYERRAEQLSADVISFNSCAAVAGCFKSGAEFDARRTTLMNEQGALNVMYERISELVDEYNAKVDKYNEDVVHGDKLNRAINSNKKMEELK